MCKFLALAVPLGRQFLYSALSPSPRLDVVFALSAIEITLVAGAYSQRFEMRLSPQSLDL